MTCQKVGYEDRLEAVTDAKIVAANHSHFNKRFKKSRKQKKQRPYECIYCGKWHLTTMKPRKK